MRYAILNKAGEVVNVIEYDGVSPFPLGPGQTMRKAKASDAPPSFRDEQQDRIEELVKAEVTKQITK